MTRQTKIIYLVIGFILVGRIVQISSTSLCSRIKSNIETTSSTRAYIKGVNDAMDAAMLRSYADYAMHTNRTWKELKDYVVTTLIYSTESTNKNYVCPVNFRK